jgi:hypothetical protein
VGKWINPAEIRDYFLKPPLTGLIPMQKTNAAGEVEVLPIHPTCVAASQALGWSIVKANDFPLMAGLIYLGGFEPEEGEASSKSNRRPRKSTTASVRRKARPPKRNIKSKTKLRNLETWKVKAEEAIDNRIRIDENLTMERLAEFTNTSEKTIRGYFELEPGCRKTLMTRLKLRRQERKNSR